MLYLICSVALALKGRVVHGGSRLGCLVGSAERQGDGWFQLQRHLQALPGALEGRPYERGSER